MFTNTTHESYLPGLDRLRALAITLVFLFHYRLFPHPSWIDTVGSFGWTGVDLFFVLSGYLISNQIFHQIRLGNFSLRNFFIKRFFRILPAYYVVLAIYFLVPSFREWEHLSPLWKFLTFTQNYGLDLRYHRTFSHAWSLCIEEQFYLLLPLIIIGLNALKIGKKAGYLIIAFFLFGFVARYFSWYMFVAPSKDTGEFYVGWYKWIYYPTYNRLDGLLVGIAIAGYRNFCKQPIKVTTLKNTILIFGLVLICFGYFLCTDPTTFYASIFGYPIIAIAYGCLVFSATDSKRKLSKLAESITSSLAILSYSIYLVHKIMIHLAQKQGILLGIKENSSLMFLFSLLFTFAGAIILHFSIERVFLKIKNSILSKYHYNS